ncbi:MAG: BhlA/UviB family holin-like peptide [Eubacteriales bacterium]|nr:BhlA/UviB family holin-like peptide [Eubacteriales bacterium]
MWNDIFNIAISNGIFAALFVALLIYELKDSRKREAKYQNTIDNLSNKLNTVDEIKQDVTEIKECLKKTPRRKNEKTDKVV